MYVSVTVLDGRQEADGDEDFSARLDVGQAGFELCGALLRDQRGHAALGPGLNVAPARLFFFPDLAFEQPVADADRHAVDRRAGRQGITIGRFGPGRAGVKKRLGDRHASHQRRHADLHVGVERDGALRRRFVPEFNAPGISALIRGNGLDTDYQQQHHERRQDQQRAVLPGQSPVRRVPQRTFQPMGDGGITGRYITKRS